VGVGKLPNSIRELRGVRWWLGKTADREQVAPLLAAAIDAVESGAVNLKSGRRKALYRLALLGDAPDHLLKVTRYRRGTSLFRRIRKSKARREIETAAQLYSRGIDAPQPTAAGECRRRGLLTACYLLVRLDPDAVDLASTAIARASRRTTRATTSQFGALAARLHAIGFRQADFAPNNFLLRPTDPPEIVPIDFERASLVSGDAGLERQERVRSLAKLERHCVDATRSARLRFLFAYAGDRMAARRWWDEIQRAVAMLFAHDQKRLRPNSRPGARRYQPFGAGDCHGWAARGATGLDAVRAWLARDVRADRVHTQDAFWVCSYREGTDPSAAELWSTSQALWVRGLAPQPICAVQRGREIRLFLDRKASDPSECSASQAGVASESPIGLPLVGLFDRLLGLGELSPDIARASVAILRRVEGSSRAVLIDVALLRTGAQPVSQPRVLARELSNRLRGEIPARDAGD